jgi:uncharacterized protein YjbI with pentapeptide repeats
MFTMFKSNSVKNLGKWGASTEKSSDLKMQTKESKKIEETKKAEAKKAFDKLGDNNPKIKLEALKTLALLSEELRAEYIEILNNLDIHKKASLPIIELIRSTSDDDSPQLVSFINKLNLQNVTFIDPDFIGLKLSNLIISGVHLIRPNFKNATIEGCTFDWIKFENADFDYSIIKKTHMKACELESAGMEESQLDTVHFTDCNLNLVKFSNAGLNSVRMIDCTMLSANMGKTRQCECHYHRCGSQKAYLSSANLMNNQYFNCNLDQTNFSSASIKGVRISECTVMEANFADAVMKSSRIDKCKVNSVDMCRAKHHKIRYDNCGLNEADFQNATFVSVDIDGCTMDGVNMRDTSHSKGTYMNWKGNANFKGAVMVDVEFRDSDVNAENLKKDAASLDNVSFTKKQHISDEKIEKLMLEKVNREATPRRSRKEPNPAAENNKPALDNVNFSTRGYRKGEAVTVRGGNLNGEPEKVIVSRTASAGATTDRNIPNGRDKEVIVGRRKQKEEPVPRAAVSKATEINNKEKDEPVIVSRRRPPGRESTARVPTPLAGAITDRKE